MKVLLLICLVLAIILSGCVSKDVTSVVNSLPEVQQYLKEHPDAQVTATYWTKDEISKSVQDISKQCDRSIVPADMYKVVITERNLKITSWIDAKSEVLLCSLTGGTNDPVPTVVQTYTPVPTYTDVPIPTQIYTPIPTQIYTPIPTQIYTPVPTQIYTPVQIKTSTPVPTQTYTPVPTQTYTPVPIYTDIHVPKQTYTPVPIYTDIPVPKQTYTPVPTQTSTPVPKQTYTPVPIYTDIHVPTRTVPSSSCDPSYPDVCIPPYPPDLNCKDIPYKNFRVLQPDPHGFDRDKDGIGCES